MKSEIYVPEFESMLLAIQSEDAFVRQLFDYYHQRLLSCVKVCHFLAAKGIGMTHIERCRLGYSDRTLNRFIRKADTVDGGAFRGCLRHFALLKLSGHELFSGCVVEPIFDDGHVVAACGIRTAFRVRRKAPSLLYWYRHDVYTRSLHFTLTEIGDSHVSKT